MSLSLWEDVLGKLKVLEKKDKLNCLNIGAPFDFDSWDDLSSKEKDDAINNLMDFLVQRLSINEKPSIVFKNTKDKSLLGGYDIKRNEIIIYQYNNHPRDGITIACTIGHEMRHAYQVQRISEYNEASNRRLGLRDGIIETRLATLLINPNNEPIRQWKENLKPGNYIQHGPGYRTQAVEYDAFSYQEDFFYLFFMNSKPKRTNKR